MAVNKYRDLHHKEPLAYWNAAPITARWAASADFTEVGDFKTMRIFRKAAESRRPAIRRCLRSPHVIRS